MKKQTWLQLLVTVGLLALMGISFRAYVLAPREQTSAPEKLGTLSLVNSVEGSEALQSINTLHGTDIELMDAYIAEYAGSGKQVTVWVGKTASQGSAAELIRRMFQAISQGGSGFSNPKRLSVTIGYHNHEVVQIEGSGGKHFFYQSREVVERVVWLTIEAPDPLAILEQAVRTL